MAETPEDALDKMSGAKAHDIMLKADRFFHDNSLTMLEVSLRPAPDRRPLPCRTNTVGICCTGLYAVSIFVSVFEDRRIPPAASSCIPLYR